MTLLAKLFRLKERVTGSKCETHAVVCLLTASKVL